MDENDRLAVSQLRKALGGDLSNKDDVSKFGTDFDLLRWLQGYDFDVEATAKNLRHHLEFRNASKFTKSDFVPNPIYLKGLGYCNPNPPIFSKDNLLLYVEFMGAMDHVGLMRHRETSWADLFQLRLHQIEEVQRVVRQHEEETGKQSGVYLLWDMSGYRIGNTISNMLTMSRAVRHVGEFMSRHQVEFIKKVVVIHPPPLFHTLWSIVAPFSPAKYREKVRILHAASWKEELAADFDGGLPDFLGGVLEVDKNDKSVYNFPDHRIPLNEYFNKGSIDESQFEVFSVSAGKTLVITFKKSFAKPEVIAWVLFTNAPCNFGVFHQNQSESGEESDSVECVYPEYRPLPASQHCPEMDSLEVTMPGIYRMKLHNASHYNIFGKLRVRIKLLIDGVIGDDVEYSLEDEPEEPNRCDHVGK